MNFAPTDEQLEIIEAARPRRTSIAALARAGAAKTTTARMIAEDQPDARLLYVGFNKKVVEDARLTFPSNTTVKTNHALAYSAIGKHFKDRIVRSQYKMKVDLAERFHTAYARLDGDPGTEDLAFLATLDTINGFTASADLDIEDAMVPEGPYDREKVAALARGVWDAMTDPSDSSPITDDAYLKMWQLALAGGHYHVDQRGINADLILYDEGQDANPASLDIMERSGVPMVLLGDPRQKIYSWRGAVNAFDRVDFERYTLTANFRFGREIAMPANEILTVLGEAFLIDARGPRGKVVVNDDSSFPNAIISRTNAGIISEAVRIIDDTGTIHIVGGHDQLFSWLGAAYQLWKFGRSPHPSFAMFKTWEGLKRAAGAKVGRNYKPFVDLVETYRNEVPDLLMRLESATRPLDGADTVLSTPYKLKGDEFVAVRLGSDFGNWCESSFMVNGAPFTLNEEEAHVMYVALTRAKEQLDLGGAAGVLRQSLANARALLAHNNELAPLT